MRNRFSLRGDRRLPSQLLRCAAAVIVLSWTSRSVAGPPTNSNQPRCCRNVIKNAIITRSELAEIKRLNGSKQLTIHTIALGYESDFLRRLAKQNRGEYVVAGVNRGKKD